MSATRDVRAELLEFAWDQWAQMGLLAEPRHSVRWVMDPEALVVLTFDVARADPRLFDEVLDWLWINGRLISVQRLRNLSRVDPLLERIISAALAWVSTTGGAIKLPAGARTPRPTDDEPLFVVDGHPLRVASPDPSFAQFGLVRSVVKRGARSRRPDLSTPINLAFRLRLLFGVGSRAESVRCLLTDPRPELSVADVAEIAGYAKRNVADALAALTSAGVVAERTHRNGLMYRLQHDRWSEFLDLDTDALQPSPNWPALLRALLGIESWIAATSVDLSDQMRASRARDLIDLIGPDLSAAGIALPPANPPGAAYLDGFWHCVDDTLARLTVPVALNARTTNS